MTLKRLPVDISTFSLLRQGGYLYIDKTSFAHDLITQGRRFFLSRPRRFGKSLFLSTLKEILSGNRKLFKGLSIDRSDYSWKPHAVIPLDFSQLESDEASAFKEDLTLALQELAEEYKVAKHLRFRSPKQSLRGLVKALHAKFGAVSLLIDEYDFPLLQSLSSPQEAKKIRSVIRDFFAALKGLDAYVDFVFITGVTAFSKAGIFSGMNNLQILSLEQEYGAICGYTDEEVDHYFKPYLQAWAKREKIPIHSLRNKIKEWYNGYRFGENVPSVYNPFSLVHAIAKERFENFWFASGTPFFLVEELKKEQRRRECEVFDLEQFQVRQSLLQSFDIKRVLLPALLFQTGYLTLDSYDSRTSSYHLKYPNFEVKTSLHQYLFELILGIDPVDADKLIADLGPLLAEEDVEKAVEVLRRIFAHVPAKLHMEREAFYHALIQVACTASGIKAHSEYETSQGTIDLVLELRHVIYLIEIKLNRTAKAAMAQMKRQKYMNLFLREKKRVWLLGLGFQRSTKRKSGKSAFELTYVAEQASL